MWRSWWPVPPGVPVVVAPGGVAVLSPRELLEGLPGRCTPPSAHQVRPLISSLEGPGPPSSTVTRGLLCPVVDEGEVLSEGSMING